MADYQTVSTPRGPRGTLRARPNLRSSSQSPARQHRLGDDLLSRLAPDSAVDALRSPTGALKTCLDKASTSEQAFALTSAIASKKIHDWLDELSDWPWPSSGGSTGFEMPPTKRRKLFEPETPRDSSKGKLVDYAPQSNTPYLGSLPAEDVARYEIRVERIQEEMEELDLEEIKNQVLHNHILPLSRPGTPFSDAGQSVSSTISFAKMEDLTAVITAITIQTLPLLSKLTRLLNTWIVRLVVLRKVPNLLAMISDAENALRSGWSAIKSANQKPADSHSDEGNGEENPSVLSRQDFEVMKYVLSQKVSKPGRDLDYMLDALEGHLDTLPDHWLDRMEAIERDYVEWETFAERRVRQGELFGAPADSIEPAVSPGIPDTPRPKIHVEAPSPKKESSGFAVDDHASMAGAGIDSRKQSTEEASAPVQQEAAVKILVDAPNKDVKGSSSQVMDLTEHAVHQHHVDSGGVVKAPSLDYRDAQESEPAEPEPLRAKLATDLSESLQLPPPKQNRSRTFDGSDDVKADEDEEEEEDFSSILSEVDRNIVRGAPLESTKTDSLHSRKSFLEDDFEPSILESVNEEDEEEPELPPTRFGGRRGSNVSLASTVIHSNLLDHSDNGASREASLEPELPRLPDPDEPFSSDALSPPSSPPLRYKPRSTSVTFKDLPEVAPLPEAGGTPPRSPLEPSPAFDHDTSFEWDSQLGSPSRMSTISSVSEDDHLQRQIRNLLQDIPAKIRLKRSGINLNPPDLQLPGRPKGKPDPIRRSGSAMSSRAGTPSYSRSGTPSFMLAPARESRPRSKSSQAIRVYHLSRPGGDPPIKLFVRSVGENGERVMVRVGGGWADLGEYLRDYAVHHTRRSKGEGKVEIIDAPPAAGRLDSSPSSRPGSALDSPITPLAVRKTRRSLGPDDRSAAVRTLNPKTPKPASITNQESSDTPPSSEDSVRSRASSANIDWDDEDSALGLSGPRGVRRAELSEESRQWVQDVKEKVRIASGERLHPSQIPSQTPNQGQSTTTPGSGPGRASSVAAVGRPGSAASSTTARPSSAAAVGRSKGEIKTKADKTQGQGQGQFGEIGKVGSTKRLFRKG
ncbi:hypothetical protein F4778DRAFT_130682 [Xylariomycetidae sp. FL2044]|nr:hypothetical protein F4778DRAFT_130682 [Xylariomycetidae sp. FL2044]